MLKRLITLFPSENMFESTEVTRYNEVLEGARRGIVIEPNGMVERELDPDQIETYVRNWIDGFNRRVEQTGAQVIFDKDEYATEMKQ